MFPVKTKKISVKSSPKTPKTKSSLYASRKEGIRGQKEAIPEYSPPKTDLERARLKAIRIHERLVGAHDQRRCLQAANEELNDKLEDKSERNRILEQLDHENNLRLNELHRQNAELQHQVGASAFDLQNTQALLRDAVEKLEDMCKTSTDLSKELEQCKEERDQARLNEQRLMEQVEQLLREREDGIHRVEFESLKRQEAELQSGLLQNEVKILTHQRTNLENSLYTKAQVSEQMRQQYNAKIQAYTRDFEALTAISDTLADYPSPSKRSPNSMRH